MNYYPHHIGDFNNATRHLTRIERSIYRDMLDLYYDTEQPLTSDFKALCRKLLANAEDESTAVQQVLNEFFTETASGWYHARCEAVIQEYRDNITAKSAAGKASAAKREKERLEKLNNSSTHAQQPLKSVDSSVQQTTTQEPLPNTQKPISKTSAKNQGGKFSEEFEEAWVAYPDRPGASKKESFKAWTARLNAGVDPPTILSGVKRYAAFVEAMRTEPRFIKQPATFFGPDEHYRSDWSLPEQACAGPPLKPGKFDPTAYVNRNRNPQNERIVDINEHGESV